MTLTFDLQNTTRSWLAGASKYCL